MKTISFALIFLCFQVAWGQGILAPSLYLGYEFGTEFTPHHRALDYVEYVASQKENVVLQPYGETYEGRPLVLVVISSPSNMARIEEIRTNNLKNIGLLSGESTGFEKPIVWLSYNVHGNESVSTEAALQTLFDLASENNRMTKDWLEEVVVIIDPCINPDGRERYINGYKQARGVSYNPDLDAREHRENWPGGRTNHYWFDLNRDWAWATQIETQERILKYQAWMPHIHVDFHEMGINSPYFFAPAAEPFHQNITAWQRELQSIIGKNNARYFDENRWLYFTREEFDLFYPAYGDTWPTYQGAVGMTYEQGGGGAAGLGVRTALGDTLTLKQRIAHHHMTGLSTIEVGAKESERIVSEFKAFYHQKPNSKFNSFIVKKSNGAGKISALRKFLETQGISYSQIQRNGSATGVHFETLKTERFDLEIGDLVVNLNQPRANLASILFEPQPVLVDSVTYDITAWSLPYVYDVKAYAVDEMIEGMPFQDMRLNFAKTEAYAYLAKWESFEDAKFLASLLKQTVRVRVANKPIEIDNQKFDVGTLVITKTGNQHLGSRFDEIIRSTAISFQKAIVPVTSGYSQNGIDLGSGNIGLLKIPRIALLAGEPLSSYNSGELWHFFDQQLAYPVTLIDPDRIGNINLSSYDVLILPSGSYGNVLSESHLDAVKTWVRGGGTLIAIENAMRFLADKEGFSLKTKKSTESSEEDEETVLLKRYGNREREQQSDNIPGAIYVVDVDNSHPLGYGFRERSFFLKQNSNAYQFFPNDWNVGTIGKEGIVSGFVGENVKRKLENVLVYGVETMGRGNIVYFSDTPIFRGFWYSGRQLLSNAIFMVGQ